MPNKNNRRGDNSTAGGVNQLNSDTSRDEPLSPSEMKIINALESRISTLMDIKFAELESVVIKRVEDLESSISKQESLLKCQDIRIKALEDALAKKELFERRENFIVKGIPENAAVIDTLANIASIINVELGTNNCLVKDVFRLGAPRSDGSSRPVLVKANRTVSFNMVSNGKKLRQHSQYSKIYIDRDLPPSIAKALGALRKRAFEWRRDNPGDTAYVKGGQLFINDVVIDQVKLQ